MTKADRGILLQVLSTLSLTGFLICQLNNLLYDASIDFVEGYDLYNGMELFLRGHNIYSCSAYVTPYPPLGYLLSALGALLFPGCFICGCRILTLTFLALLLCLVYLESGEGKYAVLAPAIICLTPIYPFWGSLCRVDIPAIAFSLLAAALYLRDRENLAAISAAAALQFKQTAVSAIAAMLIHKYMKGGTRGAIRFLIKISPIVAAPYVILVLSTGWCSLLNIFYYSTAHQFSLLQIPRMFFYSVNGVMTVLYAYTTYVAFKRFREELYAPYFLISMFLGLLMSAKLGANTNYFLEPLAVGAVLFTKEASRWDVNRAYPALVLLLACGLIMNSFSTPLSVSKSIDVIGTKCAANVVSEGEGPIIAEDAYVAVLSGRKLVVEPFIYKQLVLRGIFKEFLTDAIKQHRYEFVVLRWGCFRFQNEFCEELKSSYRAVNCFSQIIYSVGQVKISKCFDLPALERFRSTLLPYLHFTSHFLRTLGFELTLLTPISFVWGDKTEAGSDRSHQKFGNRGL